MNRLAFAALVALAAFAGFADGLPKVVVKPMGRVIRLGTQASGYHYERMDCVSSFWAWDTAGGVMPPEDSEEYRRMFEEYADYLDATVDFMVAFDRPVAAGSVLLYGYIDTGYRSSALLPALDILEQARGYWNNVSVPGLAAGEPMYVMQSAGLTSVNYGHMTFNLFKYPQKISILEGIQRFNCALKNASPANIGTTVYVECVITVGGERLSMGGFEHKIIADPDTNWFNAHVPRYETTADLTSTNAVGGRWVMMSGEPVGSSSEITEPGVLSVDVAIDDLMSFDAIAPSGDTNVVNRLAADVIPGYVNDLETIQDAFVQHDSCLTLASDGARTNWYCVASEGGSNIAVRLTFADGSDAVYSPEDPVHVEMIFVRMPSGGSLVSYAVDGKTLYCGGRRYIPISVGDVHRVGFVNEGRVYGVYGDTFGRTSGGTSMEVR